MKKVLALAVVLSLFAGAAGAQTCSAVPSTLTNGTTADATQVMANFNYLLGCINGLRGYLGGLTLSNDGTSPNTVIDTAAGVANSDDVTTMMTLSPLTKNANAGWAVGSGNGCLDSGSGLAASTWYHLFVIARTDTGVVDELCSTSATSPALPASYTKKRRIGSFKTDTGAHIMQFLQTGDRFDWIAPVQEYGGVPGTTAKTLTLNGAPAGVVTEAILSGFGEDTSASASTMYISSLTQTDLPPNLGTTQTSTVPVPGTNSFATYSGFRVETNTAAQIRFRTSSSTATWAVDTNGWIDTRGRFN